MDERKNTILVAGIGNEILMDDGIGPRIVKQLAEIQPALKADFESVWLGGLEIIEYIQGYQQVIFIDAIKTKNGIPGDTYYFSPKDFEETLHLSNIHDVNFLTAIQLGKLLGYQIPSSILIIAIEIFEDKIFGNEFSPILRSKYPFIFKEILEFIRPLIQKS
jgi:hydrogenase maturation protease